MEDFDFNDTAPVPLTEQEFLMENLCVKKGRAPGGYEPPGTRSAAKRWKHIHEQNMMARLNGMHIIKKQNAQMSKEAAREIIRKIPVELLAKEWLSKEDATVDMRAYLVDHVLPTLILGVERLLKEVDEKGLSATNRFEPEFNPINFLAQYLMRNNPRFSNFAEASPYVRGLREVSEEIKQELFTFEDNRLARIKAEARRKRTDREKYEQQIREGKEHRHNQLISQFVEWTQYADNKSVELALLQNALNSFIETVENLPPELQEVAKFGSPLDSTDETGKQLTLKEFAQYISLFVEDLPDEVFQIFMNHLSKCAGTQKAYIDKINRCTILTNLFLICDYGELRFMIADRKLGLLDRARIMTLFEEFWDHLMETKETKLGTLFNPRRWPVVEVEEVDDTLFDAWYGEPDGGVNEDELEEQNMLLEAIRSNVLQEAEISAVKDKAAKEKWKQEQLEQKSEGYRAKLYKYNVTDFMTLVPYSYLDTMEAPIHYFDNTDGKLTKEHDLYPNTISRTARERLRKCHSAGPKQVEERKASQPKEVKINSDNTDGLSSLSSIKLEQTSEKTDIGSKSSKKPKNKNVNSNSQDYDFIDNRKLPGRPVNRNNNTLGSDDSSSLVSNDSSRKYSLARDKLVLRRKKRINATLHHWSTSNESSEEMELKFKPRPMFRRPSPFSSEDDIPPQRSGIPSLPKQPAFKCRDNSTSMDATFLRKTNLVTMPPIRKNKLVKFNIERDNTIMAEDTEQGTNMTDVADIMKNEVGAKETIEQGEDGKLQGVQGKHLMFTYAVVGEDATTTNTDTGESTSIETVEVKMIATEERTEQENYEITPEQAFGDEQIHYNDQGNNRIAEIVRDINDEHDNDGVNSDDSFQATKSLDKISETEKRDDSTLSSNVVTDKVRPKDHIEQEERYESFAVQQQKKFVDEQATEEESDGNIMKEILTSQNEQLTSRTASASTAASKYEERKINDSSSAKKDRVNLSAFSETYLDLSQFVQLVETYIGTEPNERIFATIVKFITEGYKDSEPEKTDVLLAFRDKAIMTKNKTMLNSLFEKWDNDGSGFLELDDVVDVLCKFKDGQEMETVKMAQYTLRTLSDYNDSRLSKKEFRQFLSLIIQDLPGRETFELLVEFLKSSVERSYVERIRGEARKKWLQQINLAAQTSGVFIEPVYKAVFQALYKDAETHGNEKRISASIAMLEVNKLEPLKGDLLLRYAACTPEDCQHMLGKPLFKNMKGVSFQAVESGRPVHVPRVANHGSVFFWNYDRHPNDRGGSFVAIPIKDNRKRVFGVLGVDTMIDPNKETIFITHEVHFFQGVAKAFSIAYHLVEKKRKFMKILECAMSWFHIRCPHIVEIVVYFVEPSTRVSGDYVLRKAMVKDRNGVTHHVSELVRLERKDNMFRKYLFECMETSITTVGDICEERHIACPIRDNNGITMCIVDLNTGHLKMMPRYESREAQRMIRMLQQAHKEMIALSQGEDPNFVLEAEKDILIRTDLMFERCMIQELRNNLLRIDIQSWGEMLSHFEPPRVIYAVLQATMAFLKIDQVGEGEYDDWEDLKLCIGNDLKQNIQTLDPTALPFSIARKIYKYLKAVQFAEIDEQGSIPAQQLYNWISACCSLIERMLNFKANQEGTELSTVGVEDN